MLGQPAVNQLGANCVGLSMRRSLRPGGSPPFHELGEYTFEDLCRDLFDEQPDIATCDNYGKRGQKQDGIDLYARRSSDESIEVGQCKRYQNFPPRKFRQATDDFFKHWERWSREGVRRFILFVACDVSSREQQDEISRQRARFAERHILYEVWSASRIRKELAPYRQIARQHLRDEYWVREICGDDSAGLLGTVSDDRRALLAGAVLSQNALLASWASRETKGHIERAREAWREGKPDDARRLIEELRDGSRGPWLSLSDEAKSQVLRFEAALALGERNDVEDARRLADEADRLAPAEKPTLRALIAHQRAGPEAALGLLTDAADVDSLNLRAAFLLDFGRVEEGLTTVEQVLALDPGNAEAFRLRVFAYLLDGRQAEARLAAARALELAPRWTSVRFVAAIADYASALSPGVPAGHLFPWPEPTDWSLVRRDGESLGRLRGASEVFRNLAENATEVEERRSREAWRLACLGSDPERQEDAVALCRTLLDRDLVHHQAIAWAVPRRWNVDLDASRSALEGLLASGAAALPQIVALVRIHLRSDSAQDAATVLDRFRARFEVEDADALWRVLRAQAAVQAGDDAALANVAANASPEAGRRVQTLALSARARSADDWQPLLRHLEASYEETGDPAFLLSWCEASMSRGAWAAVATRAEEVVRVIATADAVRLAAIATYNADDYERCLLFLDGHRDSFEDGRLPSDLRELRVRCQRARGSLPDALVEAETLVREDPSTGNLLHLAEIHIEKGDLGGMVRVARRLVGRSDVPTASLLRLARILALEDGRLATSLWRRAVAADLPDDLVPHAYMLGHQLGRERELAALSRRFFHLAQQGHVGARLASVQDFIVHVQQRREQTQAFEGMYAEGTVPAHFLIDRAGGSLAFPYRHTLLLNQAAPAPLHQPALLIRHGGRSAETRGMDQITAGRLHLDVTALLLAMHLGILDVVERTYAPLRIPPTLTAALVHMRDQLAAPQPERVEAQRQVLRLLGQGALAAVTPTGSGAWDQRLVDDVGDGTLALIDAARSGGGYVLEYLPLQARDLSGRLVVLPDDVAHLVVDCRSLAESLRQHGPLSDESYRSVLESLGSLAEGNGTPAPEQGTPLYCDGNLPEVLASARLLEPACERFSVRVAQPAIDQIHQELAADDRRQELAAWVSALLRRISEGIDEGTYIVLPHLPSATDGGVAADELGPASHSLTDLLRFPAADGAVIWVDDRLMTSYPARDQARIVGVYEVLGLLHHAGAIDATTYFDKLDALRAANVRFLPVQPEEIVHHLRQARVDAGRLIETGQLRTMRRYMAACIAQRELLQLPPRPPGDRHPAGEAPFALGLQRAVRVALPKIWEGGEDEATAGARAEWVLENLFLDDLSLITALGLREPTGEEHGLVAMSLVALLVADFETDISRGDVTGSRTRYRRWLAERVLDPRFATDQALLGASAEYIKSLLSQLHEEHDETRRPIVALRFQRIYRELPSALQDELALDGDFMAMTGLRRRELIDVGEIHFDAEEFWHACAEAVNGREHMLRAVEPPGEARFSPFVDEQGQPRCRVEHLGTGRMVIIGDEDLLLLRESAAEREATLRGLQSWFDCSPATFERTIAEIVSAEDPQRRIEMARTRRATSIAAHVEALGRAFVPGREVRTGDLLPRSVEGIARYLRLDDQPAGAYTAFETALNEAARALLRDVGLFEASQRLVGLPAPLPAALIEAVAALSPGDRRDFFKRLIGAPRSPLSALHLAHLLVRFGEEDAAYRRLGRSLLKSLVSEAGEAGREAFLTVLAWVGESLALRPEARRLTSDQQLAAVWVCAHHIYAISAFAGIAATAMRDHFAARPPAAPLDRLEGRLEYWRDVAHPRRVSSAALLTAGIAYAVGDQERALDDDLWERVARLVTVELNGVTTVHPSLLRDPTLACNALWSFLGAPRDAALAPFFGAATAEQLSPGSLRDLVAWSLPRLGDDDEWRSAWRRIEVIVGDLPPYDELTTDLGPSIRAVDFGALAGKDRAAAVSAIHAAAILTQHLGDEELPRFLADQLVALAGGLAHDGGREAASRRVDAPPDEDPDEIALTLLDAALAIALGSVTARSSAAFADVATRLVAAWPRIVPASRRLGGWLGEHLPPSLAGPLWPWLVRLRAEYDGLG